MHGGPTQKSPRKNLFFPSLLSKTNAYSCYKDARYVLEPWYGTIVVVFQRESAIFADECCHGCTAHTVAKNMSVCWIRRRCRIQQFGPYSYCIFTSAASLVLISKMPLIKGTTYMILIMYSEPFLKFFWTLSNQMNTLHCQKCSGLFTSLLF